MKKSLIALAVLAASGVASAQSTVTLYGLVDAYVGSTKMTLSDSEFSESLRQSAINGGGFNTSRFGLKGSEDLGGGLKANFVLESGFDSSTGVGGTYVSPFTGDEFNSVFSRQSWVGLSGGFGEVRIGKMFTPYDEVKGLGAGAFNADIFAPATNVWVSNTYWDRPGNSVYYSTPSISGFSAAAMYAFGENAAPGVDAGKIVSFNVQYAGGPVAVAFSHQQETMSGADPKVKFTQVNASYDFGVAKLVGAYGRVSNQAVLFGLIPPTVVDGSRSKEYQIGVDVPLTGALTVSGGYAHSKTEVEGEEIKSRGFGIAAKYALSKRTFAYTGIQTAKQEFLGGEVKITTYAVGIQHSF